MIKTNSKYKRKRTYSWMSQKATVKNTEKYGMGVFAKEKIFKNEKIAILGGYVMTRQEEQNTPHDIYDNAMQIDDNLVIGAIDKEGVEDVSMFNHSCNANAAIRGQILLIAIRDIESNEQITFDYGTVLFHPDGVKPYKLKCFCGDKDCRGVITDEDWKKKEIQQRYENYFPLHIQEKIDKLKQ